jgi:hypothetical protein
LNDYSKTMTFAQLERQVSTLDPKAQRKLMAYLVSLELKRDDEYRAEITRRLNDNSPGAWIPMAEVRRRLKLKA